MNETDKAYLAGLIDGEGYIGCIRSRDNYWVTLQVEMADPGPIALVAEKMRANVKPTRKSHPTKKTLYKVVSGGRKAQDFLSEILPYLIGKQILAKLVIEFPIGKIGHQTKEEDMEHRESIYYSLRELNKRGK